MEYKRFGSHAIVRMDPGEELLEQLAVVAGKEKLRLASVSGLGAVNDFTVGVYKSAEKQYLSKRFTGAFEIVSLTGTVTTKDGAFYPHLHMSAGNERGAVFGGHLNRAVVSATAELVLTLIDGTVERRFDETIGLNLMRFED